MVYHRPVSDGLPVYDSIERKYRTTLSKTNLRSDRGDLRLYTFAGSHLHGGAPVAEKPMAQRLKGNKNVDLYAPLADTPYTRGGFYDHLRATTPPPRSRVPKSSALRDDPLDYGTGPTRFVSDIEYKTVPSRFDYLESELRKPTTKTTTTVTERWVPLTTYIYHTPFHSYYYKSSPYMSYTYRTADDLYSYNYLDDYKRYATTTTKTTTKNIDALDLSTSTKFDYSSYAEKW